MLRRLASSEDRQALWSRSAEHLFEGQEAWIESVLRVLAGEADGPWSQAIRHFLFDRPIGLYWTGVAWACWPADPVLFAEAWTRYFRTAAETEWKGRAVAQFFLRRADALAVLRVRLQSEAPAAWVALRDDLRAQRGAPWLKAAERDALDAVLDLP